MQSPHFLPVLGVNPAERLIDLLALAISRHFTANTCALVYSLDAGGIRSTTDVFHDLYADNIVDTMFQDSCLAQHTSVDISRKQMYESQHWRTPVVLSFNLST